MIACRICGQLHKPLRLVLQVRHNFVFIAFLNQLHKNLDWANLIPKVCFSERNSWVWSSEKFSSPL